MNTKYIPSKGFILLFIVMSSVMSIIILAQGPTKGEYESLGHKYYAEKKFSDAAEMFIAAGKNTRSTAGKSRCFRSAASSFHALKKYKLSLRYLVFALQNNKNNRAAYSILENIAKSGVYGDHMDLLDIINKIFRLNGSNKEKISEIVKHTILIVPSDRVEPFVNGLDKQLFQQLFVKKPILYISQYKDGWSIGKRSGILILVDKENTNKEYLVELKTAFPAKYYPTTVTMKVNGVVEKIIFSPGDTKRTSLSLIPGINKIWLTIDKSFTPSKIGPSKDKRDLGVNYRVIKK